MKCTHDASRPASRSFLLFVFSSPCLVKAIRVTSTLLARTCVSVSVALRHFECGCLPKWLLFIFVCFVQNCSDDNTKCKAVFSRWWILGPNLYSGTVPGKKPGVAWCTFPWVNDSNHHVSDYALCGPYSPNHGLVLQDLPKYLSLWRTNGGTSIMAIIVWWILFVNFVTFACRQTLLFFCCFGVVGLVSFFTKKSNIWLVYCSRRLVRGVRFQNTNYNSSTFPIIWFSCFLSSLYTKRSV